MIPRAFRIRDFRSIADSGVCVLSADNITVLAGQNEAGKTAVLNALRDFDRAEGSAPLTSEYMPEGKYDAKPTVAVEFEIDVDELVQNLSDDENRVPDSLITDLKENPCFWIERDLVTATFNLDPRLRTHWLPPVPVDGESPKNSIGENHETSESDGQNKQELDAKVLLQPDEFATYLRDYWPLFVYFDSFQDTLPREVEVDALLPSKKSGTQAPPTTTPNAETSTATPPISETPTPSQSEASMTQTPPQDTSIRKSAPQPVLDFITLSGMNVSFLASLSGQDKALSNYLQSCGATITGDFLTYWKQRVDKDENVHLHVRHLRDEEGTLKLAFYVRDRVDQYPEQRSKGFLWFLSFYLRLAATEKRSGKSKRFLLIDEPGSYLHARAQRDVLHLFEDRIAKYQHIMYSTHSPFLLPPDKLHRIRIVLKTKVKGTLILDRLTHPELRADDFADTLSPIIAAIGLDFRQIITFAKDKNLLVEGISDQMYLSSWARQFAPELLEEVNIFPGTGASTLPTLASLLIGWGLFFAVLLDRDGPGNKVRDKFTREFAISEDRIVQPNDSLTIEDVFSPNDFQLLLSTLDKTLTINPGESPSSTIRRQKIDKVLLARTYAEKTTKNEINLSKESQDRIERILRRLASAVTSPESGI